MTDFPTTYVERPFRRFLGTTLAAAAARLCYWYCGKLYSRFDGMFALSLNGGMTKLKSLGIDRIEVVPLGVELGDFSPARRDPRLPPYRAHVAAAVAARRLDPDRLFLAHSLDLAEAQAQRQPAAAVGFQSAVPDARVDAYGAHLHPVGTGVAHDL